MMHELSMPRRYARSLLHEFRRLHSLNKRKLREALVRRRKRIMEDNGGSNFNQW